MLWGSFGVLSDVLAGKFLQSLPAERSSVFTRRGLIWDDHAASVIFVTLLDLLLGYAARIWFCCGLRG
jgi:hypothetical protein